MRYLLDTNILVAAMRGVEKVRDKLTAIPLSDLLLSPVVLGELQLGVEKSQHRDKTPPGSPAWWRESNLPRWTRKPAATTVKFGQSSNV